MNGQGISKGAHRPVLVVELRRMIVEKLARHLECSEDEISAHRSITSYGMSSLSIMILLGELEEYTGLEIDPELISEDMTIDELVAWVMRQISSPGGP